MFKNSRISLLILSLLLALSLAVTSCGPAAEDVAPPVGDVGGEVQDGQDVAEQDADEAEESSGPSLESNLLDWDEWYTKMDGAINSSYYVIDLRTPDEIGMEGALEGSINIDAFETLAQDDDSIIDEKLANVSKDATILVHCKSGGRVKGHLQKFLDKGYVNAFGLDGWTAFDGKGYIGAAKIDSNTEHLVPDAWTAKMEGTIGEDYYIVDARDASEYKEGHIEGAINIGVRDQWTVDHVKAAEVAEDTIADKDALILVHCAVGKRAKVAQAHLKSEGYTNVFILDNEIEIASDGSYTF